MNELLRVRIVPQPTLREFPGRLEFSFKSTLNCIIVVYAVLFCFLMLGYFFFFVNHLSFVEKRFNTGRKKKPCHLYNENSFLKLIIAILNYKLSGNLQHLSSSHEAQCLYPPRGTGFYYLNLLLKPLTLCSDSHIFNNGMVAK